MTEQKFKSYKFIKEVRKVGGAVGIIFSVSECKRHNIKLGKKLNMDDAFVMRDGEEDGQL